MKTDKENWEDLVHKGAVLQTDRYSGYVELSSVDIESLELRKFKAGVAFAQANLKHEPSVKELISALKESKNFCQDVLANANKAMAEDCPKCDYQCMGCLRIVDDCDSTKKLISDALQKLEG